MGILFNDNKALRISHFHSYLLLNRNEYHRNMDDKRFPLFIIEEICTERIFQMYEGGEVLMWGHLQKDFIANLEMSSISFPRREDYSDCWS